MCLILSKSSNAFLWTCLKLVLTYESLRGLLKMRILESCPRESITSDAGFSLLFFFSVCVPLHYFSCSMGHSNRHFCLFNTLHFIPFVENTSKCTLSCQTRGPRVSPTISSSILFQEYILFIQLILPGLQEPSLDTDNSLVGRGLHLGRTGPWEENKCRQQVGSWGFIHLVVSIYRVLCARSWTFWEWNKASNR